MWKKCWMKSCQHWTSWQDSHWLQWNSNFAFGVWDSSGDNRYNYLLSDITGDLQLFVRSADTVGQAKGPLGCNGQVRWRGREQEQSWGLTECVTIGSSSLENTTQCFPLPVGRWFVPGESLPSLKTESFRSTCLRLVRRRDVWQPLVLRGGKSW